MVPPYKYVRFTWWRGVDLKDVAEELRSGFDVTQLHPPESESELSLLKDQREKLKIRADTLIVFLSPSRAVLSQREHAPFTARDMELRERILELYPQERPTPFPWEFGSEPKFEVAQ